MQVSLSSAQTTAATWGDSYGYDNWGNLLQKNVTQGTAESMALTVNNKNQVTIPAFTYDAAGNVLSDTTNSMTYDAENRRNPTSGTTFTYDGDGRRVAKSDGTVYWVDDNFRPLSLGTNTGSITKDFVFLGSKRIAFVALSSGNPYYYLSDHLGSTAVIGSGDGKAIEWEADHFPFGNERQVFTSLVSNLYQFTGYEYDSNTGYNYAVARFEAGRWGRFLSPDAYLGSMDVRNPQSFNRYAYVLNNPLRFIDPSGLECVWDDGSFDAVDDPETGSMGQCDDLGGTWVDHEDFVNAILTNGQTSNFGDWSSSPNSVLFQSWVLPAAAANGDGFPEQPTVDDSGTPELFLIWPPVVDPINPTKVFFGRSFTLPGYNYCGPGNAGGNPTNGTDAQCQMHDQCYHDGGFSAASNLGGQTLSSAQQDRRNLCNALLCQGIANAAPSGAYDGLVQGAITDSFAAGTNGPFASYCTGSPKVTQNVPSGVVP